MILLIISYLSSSRLVVVFHVPSIRVRQDVGVTQPPQVMSPFWVCCVFNEESPVISFRDVWQVWKLTVLPCGGNVKLHGVISIICPSGRRLNYTRLGEL